MYHLTDFKIPSELWKLRPFRLDVNGFIIDEVNWGKHASCSVMSLRPLAPLCNQNAFCMASIQSNSLESILIFAFLTFVIYKLPYSHFLDNNLSRDRPKRRARTPRYLQYPLLNTPLSTTVVQHQQHIDYVIIRGDVLHQVRNNTYLCYAHNKYHIERPLGRVTHIPPSFSQ